MNITFWSLMVFMLLIAISILVYPLLRVKSRQSVAYKDSNLKINDEKLKELDADLAEGRIDRAYYRAARDELDRELLIDIPVESQENAAEHYVSSAKRHPAMALTITVFVPALVMLVYLQLGMHAAGDDPETHAEQQLAQQQEAKQQQELDSVEQMATELEARLIESGGTSQEWSMLGRAHKYLGRNELAARAFEVALESDQQNAQLMLETAEVLALNNDRQFNDRAVELVRNAYALEPHNANVLWFIGVVEYQQQNYRQAIDRLRELLPMAGDEQEVLRSIVAVVVKSRTALIEQGEEVPELEQILGVPAISAQDGATTLSASSLPGGITVNIKADARWKERFASEDTVFVYAKALSGPKMPLAVQKLKLADLPTTVVLNDSMAMMEGMNISAFDQLEISARISKTGSAMAVSGDVIGRVEVTDRDKQSTVDILIDTLVE